MPGDADLHKGHRQRMRKRLQAGGGTFENFSEHEILEMVLFCCCKRMNTNETAHRLVCRFKNSLGAVNADMDELCDIRGVSENSLVFLKLLGALPDLLSLEETLGIGLDISNFYSVCNYLKETLDISDKGSLIVLCSHYKPNIPVKLIKQPLEKNILSLTDKIDTAETKDIATVYYNNDPFSLPQMIHNGIIDYFSRFAYEHDIVYQDHYLYDGTDLHSMAERGFVR